jgi:hypothetical protein
MLYDEKLEDDIEDLVESKGKPVPESTAEVKDSVTVVRHISP